MGGETQPVALTAIPGIGEATAKALAAAGVADASALAEIDPAQAPPLEDFEGTLAWADWVEAAKGLAPAAPAPTAKPKPSKTVGKTKAKAVPGAETPAASKPAKANAGEGSDAERRAFPINWSVRVEGTTFTPAGDRPKVTEKEHAQLVAAGAVDTPWLKGQLG